MASRSASSSSSASSNDENENNNNDNSINPKQFERQSKYKNLSPEEFWKLKKKERKDRVRERNRDKKEQKNKAWDDMSAEERESIRLEAAEKHEEKRREQHEFNETCTANLSSDQTPAIVFDLHFATSMNHRDVKSTTNQIKLSCSAMRKEKYILKPIFVSGVEKELLQTKEDGAAAAANEEKINGTETLPQHHPGSDIFPHLQNFDGFKKFPHEFLQGQVTTVLDPKKTVYLTADSPNVLWELKPGENYVIGAFVDHNTMKNATFNYATKDLRSEEVGLRTARLPLGESISVGNRCKVLTINHVVDVLLNFMKTKSWKEAILGNLPTRRVEAEGENSNNNNNACSEKEAPQRRDRVENEETRNGNDE